MKTTYGRGIISKGRVFGMGNSMEHIVTSLQNFYRLSVLIIALFLAVLLLILLGFSPLNLPFMCRTGFPVLIPCCIGPHKYPMCPCLQASILSKGFSGMHNCGKAEFQHLQTSAEDILFVKYRGRNVLSTLEIFLSRHCLLFLPYFTYILTDVIQSLDLLQ